MKSFSILLALAELATANLYLDRRAPPGCVADNCLRALTVTDSLLKTTRPVLAKSDCATYQQASTTTITVTPLTATFYSTQTTLTSTVTTTTYTTGTQTSTIVVPTTTVVELPVKRQVAHPPINPASTSSSSSKSSSKSTTSTTSIHSSVPSIPAYASPCSSVSRFISACSCAGFYGTTVTVLTTLPTPSITISRQATSIITNVQISSLEITTTTTLTSFMTTTTQDVASSPPPVARAFCPTTSYPIPPNAYGITDTYSEFYQGTGVTEDPNSTAADGEAGTTITIADTGDDCDAVQTCVNRLAAWQLFGSFDLHFNLGTGDWSCVTYPYASNVATDFDVADPTIGRGYGFSYPVSECRKRGLEERC